MAIPFIITDHAATRYTKRIKPGLTPSDAEIRLMVKAPSSAPVKAKTINGHERRRLADPFCELVCKRDRGAIVVVTVLGEDELLAEGDADIAERWIVDVVDPLTLAAMKSIDATNRQRRGSPRLPEIPRPSEDDLRRLVAGLVRNEVAQRLHAFARSEERRLKHAEHVAAASESARAREEERRVVFAAKTTTDRVHKTIFPRLSKIAAENREVAEILHAAVVIDPSLAGLCGAGGGEGEP